MKPEKVEHYLNHATEEATVYSKPVLQRYMDGELVSDYLGGIAQTKSMNGSAVSV